MPNLLLAAHNAGQGKRQRDEVVEFEKNLAQNLQVLQTELKNRTYTTSAYEIFIKYEPKKRLYRYCPWMRGMATSQISCNNGIDKKASHVPL